MLKIPFLKPYLLCIMLLVATLVLSIAQLAHWSGYWSSSIWFRPITMDRNTLFLSILMTLLFLSLALVRDMQNQKIEQRRLNHLYQQLHGILESSPLSIIATDLQGVITHFNRAAEMMLDYAAHEMIGLKNIAVLHDKTEVDNRAKMLSMRLGRPVEAGFEAFVAGLDTIPYYVQEWTYQGKYGRHFPVLLSVTALKENNQIYGYLGIALDITERKAVEEFKNDFVSMVSHELRTPLTAIYGAIGLIIQQANLQRINDDKLLHIIKSNAERLIQLVNELLDFEKIEATKVALNVQSINLHQLLEKVIQLNKPVADMHQVSLKLHSVIENNFTILLDYERMQQVLTNLISNAVKYSPIHTDVIISADIMDDTLCIAVTDVGEGIPKASQANIFKKFYQANTLTNKIPSSTGLGLYISKILVERMGGDIGFESDPAKGTRFYVNFSMAKSQAMGAIASINN